jgi:hypothetical protein
MRISYTIPGLVSNRVPAPAQPETAGSSFRNRLRRLSEPVPRDWKQVLGLEQFPGTAASIGPPPRPTSMEVLDPAGERLRWHGLLERHAANVPPGSALMMDLLIDYEERQNSVVARQLAEVRG